jgi:hypothetical protein
LVLSEDESHAILHIGYKEVNEMAKLEETCYRQRWLFDPFGLFLIAVVGGVGVLALLRHGWVIGFPCVALAAIGLIVSHKHFDPD